jgi:hypothetical protein
VKYPSRSPDLTALGFSLRGALKNVVDTSIPRTQQDLRRETEAN